MGALTEVNPSAFNGDSHIARKIALLVRFYNVSTIIETGTLYGDTTRALALLAPKVITIEIDPSHTRIAQKNCHHLSNVEFLVGNSPEVLQRILPLSTPTLFYLDAHWGAYCPLIDELKVIAAAGMRPVIAIHDFLVPGKPFGFDTYSGQPYTLEWVRPSLQEIFGPEGFRYHYNTVADGANRGVIYIEPKRA